MPQAVRIVAAGTSWTGSLSLRGIYQAARPHLPWHFMPLSLNDPQWVRNARRWGADGAIVQIRSQVVRRQAHRLGMPVINLHGSIDDPAFPRVGPGPDELAAAAIEHLRSCGYPRGAFYGPRDRANADARWRAFKRLAREQDWPVQRCEPEREIPSRDPRLAGIIPDEAGLTTWLTRQEEPVGLWCTSDMWGFWVAECCHALQIPVPDQVGILGTYDDPDRCLACQPQLSSLALPRLEAAMASVACLERMLAGRPADPPQLPPPRVRIRGSTDRWTCDDPDLQRMVGLIKERACRGIGPDGLARSLHMNRRHMENRCRQVFGVSPFRLIRRQRLHTAAGLLRDTQLPIATIAERCGWATAQRFSSDFRDHFGHSPSSWRTDVDAAS